MTDVFDSKCIYNKVYEKTETVNYGSIGCDVSERFAPQLQFIVDQIERLGIGPEAFVVEVGCGLGRLRSCHPNWCGIEYSGTAVQQVKEMLGEQVPILEGDARKLPLERDSVDMYFSFATLEHVPNVEAAFSEIERVVRRGGFAILWPAWNCRPWTVKKLQQRPHKELSFANKAGKFLIPVRELLVFRFLCSFPARFRREIEFALGKHEVALDYAPLQPDFSLWDRYPHIADDDAFVSMDAHAALIYFASRNWTLISHPTFFRRLTCRGEAIIVRKN